jgi:hypothetical protein
MRVPLIAAAMLSAGLECAHGQGAGATVSQTITGNAASAAFVAVKNVPFNIAGWVTGGTTPGSSLSGTVYLERSIDGGATYLPITASGNQIESFTSVFSESWQDGQANALYELQCSSCTGTINVRISQ